MTKAGDSLRRGVINYVDVVGRQAPPESAAGVLRRAILAENDADVMRFRARSILKDLRHGRHDLAINELEAICGITEHVDPEPLHVVDVVA